MPPAGFATRSAFPSLPLFGRCATRRAEGVKGPLVILRLLRNDGCELPFCFAEGLASVISVLQRLIDAAGGASLYLARWLGTPCRDDGHYGTPLTDQILKAP